MSEEHKSSAAEEWIQCFTWVGGDQKGNEEDQMNANWNLNYCCSSACSPRSFTSASDLLHCFSVVASSIAIKARGKPQCMLVFFADPHQKGPCVSKPVPDRNPCFVPPPPLWLWFNVPDCHRTTSLGQLQGLYRCWEIGWRFSLLHRYPESCCVWLQPLKHRPTLVSYQAIVYK